MIIHESVSRDTIFDSLAVIFRILGNENPPRDTPGRRLEVLEDILRSEPNFDKVDKWYIVNRLYDIQYRRSICEMLDRYNAKYIVIPIDREAVINADDINEKIRISININQTRNFAVDFGKHIAKYTIVLDGDCIFDREGWREVDEAMRDGDFQYLSIPHKRHGGSLAEPMVAFRYDSIRRFDESIKFGEGDKLRFLFEIGHIRSTQNGHIHVQGDLTKTVGYVHHLSTGESVVESDLSTRLDLREKSLDLMIKNIQAKVPIRISGFNDFYSKIEDGLNFDYSGHYSSMALNVPDSAHIVEVGSWLGKSAIYLATELNGYGKRAKIDCIDTWDGGECPVLRSHVSKLGDVLKIFKQNVCEAGVSHMIRPVVSSSIDASKRYDDNTLDFVSIDANHDYKQVMSDLRAWYPKVKIGGMISGHDFAMQSETSRSGVIKAVLEFFQNKNLEIQPYGRTWRHIKYDDNWPELRIRRWV